MIAAARYDYFRRLRFLSHVIELSLAGCEAAVSFSDDFLLMLH